MIKNIIVFIITAFLLVTGQALWKVASAQIGGITGTVNQASKLAANAFFLSGCIFYAAATGLWIYLLGQYDYSRIYPVFVGTCVIISIVAGVVFFRENTGIAYKILGSAFILAGIFIVAKN